MSDSTFDLSQVIEAINSGPSLNAVNPATIAVNGSTQILVGFNPKRIFSIIFNIAGTLYLKLGTGAALDNYSFTLGPQQMVSLDRWNGVVSAIGVDTTNVIVTEIS